MKLDRAAYRVKQFASAFAIRMLPRERAVVEGLLSPGELALFYSMGHPALRHSLRVFRRLRRQGLHDRQLLAASLLHDVGKGRISMAHRVAAVLLEASWPGLLDRMALPQGPRWRRGFYEHQHHPELGAELARGAGSDPRVVDLIRYHHADGQREPPGLAALRMADEGS